jgi:hypothetical protein
MTGPWRVARTTKCSSGRPLTLKTSSRVVNGAQPSGVLYCLASPGLICSRYRSCTSGPVLVNPQATPAVRPSTTEGVPGKVAPITSSAFWPLAAGAFSRAKYQIAGAPSARCGSLASSGLPLCVCVPDTTQSLEPTPSRWPRPRAQALMSARSLIASTDEAPV